MKITTLPANKYHKVGSVIDVTDHQADVLIKKGFAQAYKSGDELKKPEPDPVATKKNCVNMDCEGFGNEVTTTEEKCPGCGDPLESLEVK